MPNGFHGTEEEWAQLEREICEADKLFKELSNEMKIKFDRNERGWPQRSLCWKTDINRKVSLGLIDEKEKTYNLGVGAWSDEGKKRYIKKTLLRKACSWDEIISDLEPLLRDAISIASSWSLEDLKLNGECVDL